MEGEPQLESMEVMWVKYGKMLALMDLRDVVRPDWTGYGTRLWVERQLEELIGEDSNQMTIYDHE